jgi:hypothetical protein
MNAHAPGAEPLPFMLDAYGMAAMRLGTRPRWKFGVVEGDRRRFGDRTPRPTLNLKIVREETEPCKSPS